MGLMIAFTIYTSSNLVGLSSEFKLWLFQLLMILRCFHWHSRSAYCI